MATERVITIPKTLGACADQLHDLKDKKSKAQRVVDAIDEEIKALEDHLINNIEAGDQTGVIGKKAKVTVRPEEYPAVKDWDALQAHILKLAKKDKVAAFSLLQRRPATTVFRELWAEGKKVPGVDKFISKKVSCTKV